MWLLLRWGWGGGSFGEGVGYGFGFGLGLVWFARDGNGTEKISVDDYGLEFVRERIALRCVFGYVGGFLSSDREPSNPQSPDSIEPYFYSLGPFFCTTLAFPFYSHSIFFLPNTFQNLHSFCEISRPLMSLFPLSCPLPNNKSRTSKTYQSVKSPYQDSYQ